MLLSLSPEYTTHVASVIGRANAKGKTRAGRVVFWECYGFEVSYSNTGLRVVEQMKTACQQYSAEVEHTTL